jgi:hypothetical protein
MKNLCMVLSLAGVMAVPNLFASMSVTLMDDSSKYSYGNGGEFRAVGNPGLDAIVNWNAYSTSTKGTVTAATDGSSWGYSSGLNNQLYFQTFCVEVNEEFTPGTSYSVGVSQNAMYGSQPPNGDPISIGTAWLYSQFAAGTLSGYNYAYGGGRQSSTSAGALQQAIWWLEAEPNGVRDSFINTAEDALYGAHGAAQDALIVGNSNGAYGVDVLNLGLAGAVQDQLVIVVPEATTLVAGALLLLPFGASTLRILRRNRTV